MINVKNLIKIVLFLLLTFSMTATGAYGQQAVIWTIGEKDNQADDMALYPNKFEEFLSHDFGYEDRYFMIGNSESSTQFPFVLPGPDNAWGGTGRTAGIRSHFITLGFELEEFDDSRHVANKNKKHEPENLWHLSLDFLGIEEMHGSVLKLLINGKPFVFNLAAKKKQSITDTQRKNEDAKNASSNQVGPFTKNDEVLLEVALPTGLIKSGYNEIVITSLDGGWIAFDQVKLSGPDAVALKPLSDAVIRDVRAAKFQTNEKIQPLLIDIIEAKPQAIVSVKLDNKEIYKKQLDSGRSVLEVPMAAVKNERKSSYQVLINDELQVQGNITRTAQNLVSPADYVSTMMGTAHSRWMIAPGPWMPFSMVKLSPDNQNSGWQAGYDPTFESIGTFSHIHEWTMAGLGTFPVNGELITFIGDQDNTQGGYRSSIDKTTEEAPLGYYKVDLTDYNIQAELTSLTRSSFQRYTYHTGDTGRVMVDLKIPAEYNYDLHEVNIKKVSDNRIVGASEQLSKHVWSGDVNQDYTIYFVMEFDQPIARYGSWLNDKVNIGQGLQADSAKTAGFFAEFDVSANRKVQVRTGISFVSIENAIENLQQEIITPYDWSFDAVVSKNKETWNELLSRVEITSDNWLQKQKFYSNMYRTLASRNTFSDVDGSWRSADEKIQKFTNLQDVALGCDAFWNTFWNLNQFWNLVTPEWSNKWVRSQLAMYDANGWLAKGPAGMEYVPVMVAEHEIPLIVGAYQMGIRDYDVQKAFQAIKKMQTTKATSVAGGFAGNRDLETYLSHKYVPYDQGRFSNSLEYSFDDWTVGQMAKSLGKTEDYQVFNDRGQWWKNAIDQQTGYARLRDAKGEWISDFDPFKTGANKHYVEGNAWQLTFFVPQDIPELAKFIGKDKFLERLEWGFQESEKWRYNGPNDQYWDYPVVQGNQQSMHFAYLFNWVGTPWLTQKWSRSIGDRYYGSGVSNAYLGDEDQGQMSAWYLMNAIGLFQTDGGTSVNPQYEIGSPLFEKVSIKLGGRYDRGDSFTIHANNTSQTNIYVQSAQLNGKPLNDFKFPVSELLKGGSLVLEMGPEPNKFWGGTDVKEQIRTDSRLQQVKEKAKDLVKSGFTAGDGYAEVWIRDYNTFITLASSLHEAEQTKENLRVFFRLQGKDGNIVDGFIPKQKAEKSKVSYEYIYSELEPDYAGHKNTVETDQESSLVQAVYKYIQVTGDQEFLNESIAGISVKKRLAKALEFLMKHRLNKKYGLLWGATTADWGDVQPEHPWGVVLDENSHLAIDVYDNAMFLVALDNYLTMRPDKEKKWRKIRQTVADKTMQHLWDESHNKFRPHIYLDKSPFAATFDENEIFYHGGTAVAMEANLLSKNQAKVSFDKMIDNVQKSGAPSVGLTLYPTYPAGSFQNKGMGPYDYQNGGDWTWYGGRIIKQMIKMGFYQEAYKQLLPMLDRVLANEGFYEYYSIDNQPRGSGSFRGSAGVLYDAIQLLQDYAAH